MKFPGSGPPSWPWKRNRDSRVTDTSQTVKCELTVSGETTFVFKCVDSRQEHHGGGEMECHRP